MVNILANFHCKIPNLSEMIAKNFRGLLFLLTLYSSSPPLYIFNSTLLCVLFVYACLYFYLQGLHLEACANVICSN